MKKILFIMYNLAGGGAEKVLIDLLDNIDYTRYEVDLLLIRKEGVYLNSINNNVKVKSIIPCNKNKNSLHLRLMSLMYAYFPKILVSYVIGKKYDVEIAFLEGETSKIATYSKNNHSKKISWVHTDLEKYITMSREEEEKIYDLTDTIVCVSNKCKDSFNNIYPQYKDKTKVLYNLIDTNNIINKSKEEFKYNKKYILAIGRLVKEKRFDRLIKSYKLLSDEGFSEELIILGEGELRADLEKLVDKLNLKDKVHLYGFKKNPYSYIKNCSLFVTSSDVEGLPLVVAEAIVIGKAIVSTNCVGSAELIDYGKYGILTSKNDEISLKEGIKKILESDENKRFYEQKSLERSKIFNKAKFMDEFYKLVE